MCGIAHDRPKNGIARTRTEIEYWRWKCFFVRDTGNVLTGHVHAYWTQKMPKRHMCVFSIPLLRRSFRLVSLIHVPLFPPTHQGYSAISHWSLMLSRSSHPLTHDSEGTRVFCPGQLIGSINRECKVPWRNNWIYYLQSLSALEAFIGTLSV